MVLLVYTTTTFSLIILFGYFFLFLFFSGEESESEAVLDGLGVRVRILQLRGGVVNQRAIDDGVCVNNEVRSMSFISKTLFFLHF